MLVGKILEDADVRAVVRLLGEVVAASGDLAAKRRYLISGLARVVGAQAWVWMHMRLGAGDVLPAPFSRLDGGWASEAQRMIGMGPNFAAEARFIYERLSHEWHEHITRTRNQVVSDAEWYSSPLFERYRAPAQLDDMLWSFYPIGDNLLSGLGFHGRAGAPPYGDRARALVHLVTSEIDWLHRAGTDVAGAQHVAELSPRLRQVLLLVLCGDSKKQIAQKLHLSEHTVNDYLKGLHRHFRVRSRGELMARFVSGGTAPERISDS